jgi:hypothetical protein
VFEDELVEILDLTETPEAGNAAASMFWRNKKGFCDGHERPDVIDYREYILSQNAHSNGRHG